MGIYAIERNLNSEYKRLGKVPQEEREKIIEFVNEIKITGITQHRELFYLVRLRVIYNHLKNKFLKPDKKDIIDMVLELKEKYTDKTMEDYENVMKRFYRWLYGSLPDFINIKFNHKASHDKKVDLITRADMDEMIGACNNTRDKALISLLYDSGCRIGEILTLRMSDIIFDEYGVILHVHGKTGNRSVRIVGDSISYLKDYLKSKDDKDLYLFTGLHRHNLHERRRFFFPQKWIFQVYLQDSIEIHRNIHIFEPLSK